MMEKYRGFTIQENKIECTYKEEKFTVTNYLVYKEVDGEEKRKKDCEEWKIPYTPSNRKWENERQYKEYLKEIETNGDKNLLQSINPCLFPYL